MRLIKGGFKASFDNFLRGEKLGAKVKKAGEQRGGAQHSSIQLKFPLLSFYVFICLMDG